MTARDDFDRHVAAWLTSDAPTSEPEHLLGEVLARTARTRRRSAWRIPERWISMSAITSRVATPPGVPWRTIALAALLIGTVRLLEGDRSEAVPERLYALLAEGGVLHRRFQATPPGIETAEAIERTVLHWGGSERRLAPVLDFLQEIGLGAIGEEYERRRKARAQDLLEGRSTEDIETQFTLMTRATYDRLQEEMGRIARDLKTSIPAAIEKARALGDLRENAEYEAAKQRQANAAARLQEVMGMIQRARLIENLDVDTSRVGVGTETTLRPEGNNEPAITFWILGEGDAGIAPGALSYRAPLARNLLGKEVGAEVELVLEEKTRRYRVESIRRRLPGQDT